MHESWIYQHGLTPPEIRHNIKLALRSSLPHQPMVAFQAKDIPPAELDPRTNMVLHALLVERGRTGQDPKAQNETNRTMFQIYSNSQFIIHDNNFFSCCKPHLRNLPRHTAFQLQSMRTNLEAKELPPYRPIQFDALPEPTVPKFKPRTTANPPLQPRAQWMQDTPPYTTEAEADATYTAACSWMFGTTEPQAISPGTADLRRKVCGLHE